MSQWTIPSEWDSHRAPLRLGTPTQISTLLVEDNADDSALIVRELERAGFDVDHERVDSEPGLVGALQRRKWDIVLSDFSLPQFNGPRAFRVLRDQGYTTPFVLVSGRIGEELAAEAVRFGIHDYVLKDNLQRLPLAVKSALEEARLREEQLATEKRLRESEQKFRNLIEGSIQSILVHRAWRPLFANHAMARTFGYETPEDILKLNDVLELFTPEAKRVLSDAHQSGDIGTSPDSPRTITGLRSDGTRIDLQWMSWNADWDGVPAVQSVFVDVTRQKRAEERLRAQQRLTETMLDSLPLWLSVRDRTGRHLLVNRELCEAAGKTPAELIGKTVSELGFGTPEELRRMAELDEEVMELGIPHEEAIVSLTMTAHKVHKFRVIRTPLRDEARNVLGLVTVTQDVTHHMAIEEQYRQSQRLESIGRLAGGVAHDFNNILTVILGYSESLIGESGDRPDILQDLREIHSAGQRAAELTRQLLAFSRRQVLELRPLQINKVVSGLQRFVRRLIGEDIRVTFRLDPDLPITTADESQISQVIMNLIVNARDAMPHGGALTVETSSVTLDAGYASLHTQTEPGEYIRIQVSDTGVGMDEDLKLRIFEPFFTTKESGKGTGLGLAMVYGIVKQLGGNIWVYSEQGLGTTFQVHLPIAQEGTAGTVPESMPTLLAGVANATILVVEDDDAVRRAACQILKNAGCRVMDASGGDEALRLLAESQDPVDLLLTDVVMPEMTGPELVAKVHAERPSLRVLYMSGYSEEFVAPRASMAGARLIQKPFSQYALLDAIGDLLEPKVRGSGDQ